MGFIEKIAEAMRSANTTANGTASGEPEQADRKTEADGSATPAALIQNEDVPDQEGASPDTEKSYSQNELESILEERKKEWEKERLSSLSKDSQIEELQKEILKRDLKEKVISRLNEAGLPSGAADFIQYTDEAGTMESLEKVVSVMGKLVEEGVRERLKGKTPEGIDRAACTDGYIDSFAKTFVDAMKK